MTDRDFGSYSIACLGKLLGVKMKVISGLHTGNLLVKDRDITSEDY